MGDISIIAKNINGQTTEKFRQDAHSIKNSSGQKFIQNGQKHGINNGSKQPVLALRVIKIEGPFNDKGQKVTNPKENEEYIFIATFNRKSEDNEWKKLLWIKKIMNFYIFHLSKFNSISKNKLQVSTKISYTQMRLYAYFAKPIDSVSLNIVLHKVFILFIGGAADKEEFYGQGPTKIVQDEVKNTFFKNNIDNTEMEDYYISDYLGYNEVKGDNNIQKIVNKIPNKNTPIYIIGHSLGGWNGAHLSKILSKMGYHISLLITLDPVGTGRDIKLVSNIYFSIPKPKADYWINIRTDPQSYAVDDFIADLGGQWDPNSINIAPLINIDAFKYTRKPDISHITKYSHGEAGKIFFEKIKDDLSASDFLLNSIKIFLNY